jgi:hypothetical protein
VTTLTLDQAAAVLKTTLSQGRLRELLRYEEHSGVFTWMVTRTGKARAGSVAGRLTNHGYRQIQIDGRYYHAHRLAFVYMLGRWPEQQVDHKDGVRDHNAWGNLREATPAENGQNRRTQRNNSTGFMGVSFVASRGKYVAMIAVGRNRKNLGWFGTGDAASLAYQEAKARLHGFQPEQRGE